MFVFVGSELAIQLLEKTHVGSGTHAPSTYHWLYEQLFSTWAPTPTGGFLFAAVTLVFWWVVVYYFHRRHRSIAI